MVLDALNPLRIAYRGASAGPWDVSIYANLWFRLGSILGSILAFPGSGIANLTEYKKDPPYSIPKVKRADPAFK